MTAVDLFADAAAGASGWVETVNTLAVPGGVFGSIVAAGVVWMRLASRKPLTRQDVTEKFTGNVVETYRGMTNDLRKEMHAQDERHMVAMDLLRSQIRDAQTSATEATRRADVACRAADRAEQAVEEVRGHVGHLVDWFDRGAQPPPPMSMDWLRHWLDTAKGTGPDDGRPPEGSHHHGHPH